MQTTIWLLHLKQIYTNVTQICLSLCRVLPRCLKLWVLGYGTGVSDGHLSGQTGRSFSRSSWGGSAFF